MEVKKNMEAEITIPFQEEYETLKLLISQGVFETREIFVLSI